MSNVRISSLKTENEVLLPQYLPTLLIFATRLKRSLQCYLYLVRCSKYL